MLGPQSDIYRNEEGHWNPDQLQSLTEALKGSCEVDISQTLGWGSYAVAFDGRLLEGRGQKENDQCAVRIPRHPHNSPCCAKNIAVLEYQNAIKLDQIQTYPPFILKIYKVFLVECDQSQIPWKCSLVTFVPAQAVKLLNNNHSSLSYYVITVWEKGCKVSARTCSPDAAVGIIGDLARGIEQFHSFVGRRHGDIKPDNCFEVLNTVKLGDLLSAKELIDGQTKSQSSFGVHSPAYRVWENDAREHGIEADVFSMAATYVTLRTGELPLKKPHDEIVQINKRAAQLLSPCELAHLSKIFNVYKPGEPLPEIAKSAKTLADELRMCFSKTVDEAAPSRIHGATEQPLQNSVTHDLILYRLDQRKFCIEGVTNDHLNVYVHSGGEETEVFVCTCLPNRFQQEFEIPAQVNSHVIQFRLGDGSIDRTYAFSDGGKIQPQWQEERGSVEWNTQSQWKTVEAYFRYPDGRRLKKDVPALVGCLDVGGEALLAGCIVECWLTPVDRSNCRGLTERVIVTPISQHVIVKFHRPGCHDIADLTIRIDCTSCSELPELFFYCHPFEARVVEPRTNGRSVHEIDWKASVNDDILKLRKFAQRSLVARKPEGKVLTIEVPDIQTGDEVGFICQSDNYRLIGHELIAGNRGLGRLLRPISRGNVAYEYWHSRTY